MNTAIFPSKAQLSELPAEVVQEIVKNYSPLVDDRTLKSLSLTSRRLSAFARPILFNHIVLYCERPRCHPTRFSALIDSNPSIGKFVTHIGVVGSSKPDKGPPYQPQSQYYPILPPLLWSCFTRLRSLNLASLRFPSMHDFYLIMDTLPSLRSLNCTSVIWASYIDPPSCSCSSSSSAEPRDSATFSKLSALSFNRGNIDPDSFLRHLRRRRDTIPLQSVILHHTTYPPIDSLPEWKDLFCMASETLLQAKVYVTEPTDTPARGE